jgi:hypothetical protein
VLPGGLAAETAGLSIKNTFLSAFSLAFLLPRNTNAAKRCNADPFETFGVAHGVCIMTGGQARWYAGVPLPSRLGKLT